MLSGEVPNKRKSLYKDEHRNICRVLELHDTAHGRAEGLEMLPKQHCVSFTWHYCLKATVGTQ